MFLYCLIKLVALIINNSFFLKDTDLSFHHIQITMIVLQNILRDN